MNERDKYKDNCVKTIMKSTIKTFAIVLVIPYVVGYEIPGSCKPGQFYDPGGMSCQSCPANASMTTSTDGKSFLTELCY